MVKCKECGNIVVEEGLLEFVFLTVLYQTIVLLGIGLAFVYYYQQVWVGIFGGLLIYCWGFYCYLRHYKKAKIVVKGYPL